jgi:DNA polymerase III alpha subunit (gram-positive type)
MFEFVGALHMHSNYSDGTGDVRTIAEIASEVGLDFIILTDHNTLRAKDEGFEGMYGNTMLLVGVEINDKENLNHYLAFNVKEAFSTRQLADEYVKQVKNSGGIGFLAHPHEKRNSMPEHPPFPWTAWESEDFTGIEIWNHMSEWMETLTEENKYNHFVHPLKTIKNPPHETLEKWDELNQKRLVVGIGGIDAHAHKVNFLGFFEVEVFPYKVLFKSIRTHILTEKRLTKQNTTNSNEKNKQTIYKALEKGRCFVANSYYGNAKGFRFVAEVEGKIFNMGETISLSEKILLKIESPDENSEIKLIRNGKLIFEEVGKEAKFLVNLSGVYRVEVYKENSAWIFSNPIRIGI